MAHYLLPLAGSLLIGLSVASTPVCAKDYPVKPLRVIVPTQPGGGYDFIGRLLTEKLPAELGQPVLVENRAGAGALVGTQAVATAPADGYTLLIGGLANLAFSLGLYERPGYNPVTDFTPIALVGSNSYTLIGRKDLPQSSLQEIVAFARANPGKLSIATAGTGTGQHVTAALLKVLAKIDMLEVPYKGAQPAYTDILAGRVDLFFDNTTTARPFIESERVKAFVTSGTSREASLPKVPTGKEAGTEGLVLENWIGLFAPAKTPKPALEELRGAMTKVMRSPDLLKRLETNDWKTIAISQQDSEAFVKSEAEKWTQFIRKAGIKAQ